MHEPMKTKGTCFEMIARLFLFIFCLCLPVYVLLPVNAAAENRIQFAGEWIQGGLVVGRTLPGSVVRFGRIPIRVSSDGWFVAGFGRDAPPDLTVHALFPDGQSFERSVTIEQRVYDIQHVTGLPSRQVTPNEADQRKIRKDADRLGAVRATETMATFFTSGFTWPVEGRVSGVFGSQRILNGNPRSPHRGIDIAAPEGTPVVACTDGTVMLVDQTMYYTGGTVMVDHGHGLSSIYAHLSAVTVEEGEFVRKGDTIGRVGMSGRATGPHLHWGLSVFGTHVDPLKATDLQLDSLRQGSEWRSPSRALTSTEDR